MRLAATVVDVIASEGASRSEAIPTLAKGDRISLNVFPRTHLLAQLVIVESAGSH